MESWVRVWGVGCGELGEGVGCGELGEDVGSGELGEASNPYLLPALPSPPFSLFLLTAFPPLPSSSLPSPSASVYK